MRQWCLDGGVAIQTMAVRYVVGKIAEAVLSVC